jgi:hypothetical protein
MFTAACSWRPSSDLSAAFGTPDLSMAMLALLTTLPIGLAH